MAMKAQLRAGLSSLPAPRNDFEIVIPEQEEEVQEQIQSLTMGITQNKVNCECDLQNLSVSAGDDDMIEDASDIEAKKLQELKEKGNAYY